MTLRERRDAFKAKYYRWPASWPWVVQEQGHYVLYAVWVIGNDYRNKSRYYGAYPNGFLDRVMALFPDVLQAYDNFETAGVLHAFSGSLPSSRFACRLDLHRRFEGSDAGFYQGSVYDAPRIFPEPIFPLVIADPPYSSDDAKKYDTPMVNRRRALQALAQVTVRGGHLAWLDTCWPMHRKAEWITVGRILVQRSTNHRARVLSLFERAA